MSDAAQKGRNNDREGKRRGNPWLAVVIVLLLAGAGVWFWLGRHPEMQQELGGLVENSLSTAGNSARNLADSLKNSMDGEIPPPEIGTSDGGILPGAPPKAQTPVFDEPTIDPATMDAVVPSGVSPQDEGASERGLISKPTEQTAPPASAGRQDDAVLRTEFISDLAAWLVRGYRPAAREGRAGTVTVSMQAANLRYGMNMTGLGWVGDSIEAGRQAALKYFFTPSMLDALYRLYKDRFMTLVEEQLTQHYPNLSPAQKADFYQQYARRFRGISGALQGIAAMQDFSQRMQALQQASQRVVKANRQYSDLVFAYDTARNEGNKAQMQAVQPQMAQASKAYQQAVLYREQQREQLVRQIKRNPAAGVLNEESILYIASWMSRRVQKNPANMEAGLQGATLFLDLAQQFETVSAAAQPR